MESAERMLNGNTDTAVVFVEDLMNGTPIIDIKPYLPYTDSHPDATGGFTDTNTQAMQPLEVNIPENLACRIGADTLAALRGTLACDPRPRYQHDPERIYGMTFANREVKFKVDGTTVTVISID